jgi:hypothetical protein
MIIKYCVLLELSRQPPYMGTNTYLAEMPVWSKFSYDPFVLMPISKPV